MKKIIKNLKEEHAFTLLEMSIVILIVAMLLLIIIPNIGRVESTVDKTTGDAIEETIKTQKIIYRLDNNLASNADVDLGKLVEDGYITKEQMNHYRNRPSNDK